MLSLCEKLKVPLIKQYEKGKNIIKYKDQMIYYTGLVPKIAIFDLINYGWQQYKLDKLAQTVNLKEPMKTKNALYLDSITFGQYIDEKFRERPGSLIKRAFEIVFGPKVSKISLLHALQYIKSGLGSDSLFKGDGGAQQYKIVGGTSVFTDALSKKFKQNIILNSPVTHIEFSRELVRIKTNKNTYECARVIVAVPPRLLKTITFIPQLSDQKQYLINNQKAYGHIYKFYLIYREAFWRRMNYSGQCLNTYEFILYLQITYGLIVLTLDGESSHDVNYAKLIGFLDQDEVQKYQNDKQKITKAILAELEVFYGKQVHQYLDIVYGDILSSDQYINGCPTGINGVGVLTKSQDIPEKNVDKIYWASTETSDIWQGFMEGAVRSGERAVYQILGEKYNKKVEDSFFDKCFSFIKLVIVLLISFFMIQITYTTLGKYYSLEADGVKSDL